MMTPSSALTIYMIVNNCLVFVWNLIVRRMNETTWFVSFAFKFNFNAKKYRLLRMGVCIQKNMKMKRKKKGKQERSGQKKKWKTQRIINTHLRMSQDLWRKARHRARNNDEIKSDCECELHRDQSGRFTENCERIYYALLLIILSLENRVIHYNLLNYNRPLLCGFTVCNLELRHTL